MTNFLSLIGGPPFSGGPRAIAPITPPSNPALSIMICDTSLLSDQSYADATVNFNIDQTVNVKTACLYIAIFYYTEFCKEKRFSGEFGKYSITIFFAIKSCWIHCSETESGKGVLGLN